MTQPSPSAPGRPPLSAMESQRAVHTGLVTALISVSGAVTLPATLILLLAIHSAASNAPHGYGIIFGTVLGLPLAAVAVVLSIVGLVIMAAERNSVAPRSRMVLQAAGFTVIGVNVILVAVDLYMFFTK